MLSEQDWGSFTSIITTIIGGSSDDFRQVEISYSELENLFLIIGNKIINRVSYTIFLLLYSS